MSWIIHDVEYYSISVRNNNSGRLKPDRAVVGVVAIIGSDDEVASRDYLIPHYIRYPSISEHAIQEKNSSTISLLYIAPSSSGRGQEVFNLQTGVQFSVG